MSDRKDNWRGMNWVRQDKRLAIYLRDGLACAYCGSGIEEGIRLSLDHIVPDSRGGDNHELNLVTACDKCNSSRGNRSVIEFASAVAGYVNRGLTSEEIRDHVMSTAMKDLRPFRKQAREMMAERGSCFQVLHSQKESA